MKVRTQFFPRIKSKLTNRMFAKRARVENITLDQFLRRGRCPSKKFTEREWLIGLLLNGPPWDGTNKEYGISIDTEAGLTVFWPDC